MRSLAPLGWPMAWHGCRWIAGLLPLMGVTLAAWAGSYQAICAGHPSCVVRLNPSQISVDDQVIPLAAISGWSKGGPGLQSDPALGVAARILIGPAGRLLYGPGHYLQTFSIRYTTSDGQTREVAVTFDQLDQGRFFETEFMALTGLPITPPAASPVRPVVGPSDR